MIAAMAKSKDYRTGPFASKDIAAACTAVSDLAACPLMEWLAAFSCFVVVAWL